MIFCHRGSLGFVEKYGDVFDYANKHIPDLHTIPIGDCLDDLNKLFGTDYKNEDLIEDSLIHWQSLLPVVK